MCWIPDPNSLPLPMSFGGAAILREFCATLADYPNSFNVTLEVRSLDDVKSMRISSLSPERQSMSLHRWKMNQRTSHSASA
jgi:hypothetical protein